MDPTETTLPGARNPAVPAMATPFPIEDIYTNGILSSGYSFVSPCFPTQFAGCVYFAAQNKGGYSTDAFAPNRVP